MDLSRNQKILLGIVGVAVLTVTTIIVVKKVRSRNAARNLNKAQEAKKDYDKVIQKAATTITEVENAKAGVLIAELKDLVVEHEHMTRDEFVKQMDDIIIVADELKHSRFPTGGDKE